VEGTSSYGAGLTRYLRAQAVRVVEVDRPDRKSRRMQGKSDPLDACSAARAVASGRAAGVPKSHDGVVESIRCLHLARRSAIKARTQAVNQIRALFHSHQCFGHRDPSSPSRAQRVGPQIAREGPRPVSGVLSSVVKDRPLMRVKDLPTCGQTVELWWRKRRLRCGERLCPRRSFTQAAAAVRRRVRSPNGSETRGESASHPQPARISDNASDYITPQVVRSITTTGSRRALPNAMSVRSKTSIA
jgi:transposase